MHQSNSKENDELLSFPWPPGSQLRKIRDFQRVYDPLLQGALAVRKCEISKFSGRQIEKSYKPRK